MNNNQIFCELQMTNNSLLFDHIKEGIEIFPINVFSGNVDETSQKEEQERDHMLTLQDGQDTSYFGWQIFD